MKINKIKNSIFNICYFLLIIVITGIIASLSITRRFNSYASNELSLSFFVVKPEFSISNSLAGKIEKIHVKNGDSVKKGDILISLSDKGAEAKLNALEEVANENISAKTEAEVIKSQQNQYQILSPTDGTVYQIKTHVGEFVNVHSTLLVLFSNENISLIGYVPETRYSRILQDHSLFVYSSRFNQVFNIELDETQKVVQSLEKRDNLYEVQFIFSDPRDGESFIQGETLELVGKNTQVEYLNATERIAFFWNNLLNK